MDKGRMAQTMSNPESDPWDTPPDREEFEAWARSTMPLGADGNQCDGCRRGLAVDKHGQHRGPGGFWAGDVRGCTAHLYLGTQELTKS